MPIILNHKNPFINANYEEIAQFFITRVDLLPNYSAKKLSYNDNGSIRASYYEGYLAFFDHHELDECVMNKLNQAVKVITDAYTYSKIHYQAIKGELEIYSKDGGILIGLTSWNRDYTIDFNRKAALESMIKARNQAMITEATEKLLSAVHAYPSKHEGMSR